MEDVGQQVLTLSTFIQYVEALVSEAEIAALFYMSRETIPLRVTMEELEHPQPPTTITRDNNTAHGLTTSKMAVKQSKVVDMQFHWLKHRNHSARLL
eukprot:3795954-Ditylum_brightwellii.AAC.1